MTNLLQFDRKISRNISHGLSRFMKSFLSQVEDIYLILMNLELELELRTETGQKLLRRPSEGAVPEI